MRSRRSAARMPRFAVLFLACLCCFSFAFAEVLPALSMPEKVKGFTPCEIAIFSPSAGEAELSLADSCGNSWFHLRQTVPAGESRIPWDGTAAGGEPLPDGEYVFTLRLTFGDGTVYGDSAAFQLRGSAPAVLYALPSSGTLYPDGGEKWFVECASSVSCGVVMEVFRGEELLYSKEQQIPGPDGQRVYWNGRIPGSGVPAPGTYTVTFRPKRNPEYAVSFPLEIAESTPALPEIAETGPVVPERGMSDEEIWEIMMKPSVVISGAGIFKEHLLLAAPEKKAQAVGSLRCSMQAVEVLGIENGWARLRAWSHDGGQEVTGYLPLSRLTVSLPARRYAVLIDKREQTLTVWKDGHPIGTVPVSTGLADPDHPERETPAGAFLTDIRTMQSFASGGYRYEYPVRYDASNLIHGVGYKKNKGARDYSEHLPQLGQKASHGCTRVSSFVSEDCPINIYWLWTRLPYRTRVIVLDD